MTLQGIYTNFSGIAWTLGWTIYFTFMLVVFWFIIFYNSPSDIKAKAACDRYVSTLINSDDLVEITRANAMIDHLNCRIRTRL